MKIFAHPEKIAALQKGEPTAPIYIRIKPTNVCNHKCNYCHYGSGKYLDLDGADCKSQIPWEKMQEIIADMGDMGVKAVTFSGGGEPLIYPQIKEAMQAMLDRGIDISIITNGSLLKGEIARILTKAKWVRISLDAANASTYAKIRDISVDSFHEVCNNIREFAKQKPSECELGINFIVTHENATEVYEVGKLLFDLGVNHIKFTARMTNDVEKYHAPFKEQVIEQIHRLQKELVRERFTIINLYESDFELCSVFHRSYSNCLIKNMVSVIAADSKVYYCHDKAYLPNGMIGDLSNRSLKEMWFSHETQQKFRNFDAAKECDHHCVYDERNILLNTVFSLDKQHINFI
jgi:sulfatase maturation enzyme AslB (radical SAM superfamily)